MIKRILAIILITAFVFCEMSVFAVSLGDNDNIALNKPATADSDLGDEHDPGKAVDGRVDTLWSQGGRSYLISKNSFWQVDLLSQYNISKIVVYLRWDMDLETCRQNFSIQLSNDLSFADGVKTVYTQGAEIYPYQQGLVINVDEPENYRYVRVQKTDESYFVLSEIKVYQTKEKTNAFLELDNKPYAKEQKLLSHIGVIDNKTFSADSFITRGQAVDLVCRLKNVPLSKNTFFGK